MIGHESTGATERVPLRRDKHCVLLIKESDARPDVVRWPGTGSTACKEVHIMSYVSG